MSDPDFRDLVRRMRAAQKAYFKSRDGGDLAESKRLEKLVDGELDEPSAKVSLFGQIDGEGQ